MCDRIYKDIGKHSKVFEDEGEECISKKVFQGALGGKGSVHIKKVHCNIP